MSSELAGLEDDLKGFREQLEVVQSSLQSDPENVELQTLETELKEAIETTESLVAEIKPAAPPPKSPTPPPVEKPKWSKENHPAFQPGFRRVAGPQSPAAEETPVVLKVNDTVLAKWLSGDKSFYPAKITSITGSSSNPIYYVTFKSYGNTETLRGGDIKPIANNDSKKRKADGTPASTAVPSSAPPGGSGNSNVISAAANINPALAHQAKKEPSKVSDGPSRPAKIPRKVKANRELEAGKSKWQNFTAKSKGKVTKKDSMFRTGEGINARVGFTGSGQAMRKDPARSRHVYEPTEDDNY